MTRKQNIIVVGNGLFGSIAVTLCRQAGHDVTVIADDRPMMASKASGCVLAPSWLSSLDGRQIETAMEVLAQLYPLHDLEFKTNLLKTFRAKRVSLDDVLVPADIVGKVTWVGDGEVKVAGEVVKSRNLKGKVLVATGVWAKELIADMPNVRGLYGASVVFRGVQMDGPKIHAYAPYKQAVGFNLHKKSVWFGDGTALVESTWVKERNERVSNTVNRGHLMLSGTQGVNARYTVTEGARPYVEGHKQGFFKRISPKTWVSTGGAKNGTVLAAWQAKRFLDEVQS